MMLATKLLLISLKAISSILERPWVTELLEAKTANSSLDKMKVFRSWDPDTTTGLVHSECATCFLTWPVWQVNF